MLPPPDVLYCTVLHCTVLCRYAEDWGEQMVAKVNPVIVRLSLASEQPVEASVVPGDQHQMLYNTGAFSGKFWKIMYIEH